MRFHPFESLELTLPWSNEFGIFCLQGPEMIRVSKFYKDSKEGKFITSLDKDTRTLYDTFRKGAKESSKWMIQDCCLALRR
jgi:hypothetical protein